MTKLKQILAFFIILIPSLTYSQNPLIDKEKNAVIENIKILIDSNFVFIDKIKFINNSLDSFNFTGKYNDINDYNTFAIALTDDLVEITKDKHFKVQYIADREQRRQEAERENQEEPEEVVQVLEVVEEERIDWNLWYAKKENFGFEKVEILGGNIGYIKFNFWHHLDWVKPTVDATMRFVANTDALIIDLTDNNGGYSPTDSYLGSYFFDEESILWSSSYSRHTKEIENGYTFQKIGGDRYLNKPVYILVSENTFSLAEQFSYCMKHFGKAIIIGQNSAGASHAITWLEVNDNYNIQVPVSYNINPVTKTDWEGIGVIPNINSGKSEALKTAHLIALNTQIDKLKKQTIVGPILKRYDKIKAELNNK